MFRLRFLVVLPSVAVATVGVLAAMILLGGCAGTEPPGAAAVGGATKPEPDGLPRQVAPTAALRQVPDDAAEPYSFRYGATVSALSPPVRLALPARPLSPAEQDAVIAAAITAHEIRRP